jgi:hypothetical protein
VKSATILFDALTFEREHAFTLDVWYANHYLPALAAAGRFASLRRYLSPVRGSGLALFEVSGTFTPADLLTPVHERVVSHERFVADAIGARVAAGSDERVLEADVLYPVFFRVPVDREREFDAWYEEEHMELLLRCEHWRMCRRYRIRDAGGGFTHLALHYLTDLRALESPERDRARSTPWRDRLAAEPWFKGEYRVYYQWGGRLDLARR